MKSMENPKNGGLQRRVSQYMWGLPHFDKLPHVLVILEGGGKEMQGLTVRGIGSRA